MVIISNFTGICNFTICVYFFVKMPYEATVKLLSDITHCLDCFCYKMKINFLLCNSFSSSFHLSLSFFHLSLSPLRSLSLSHPLCVALSLVSFTCVWVFRNIWQLNSSFEILEKVHHKKILDDCSTFSWINLSKKCFKSFIQSTAKKVIFTWITNSSLTLEYNMYK